MMAGQLVGESGVNDAPIIRLSYFLPLTELARHE
jgi:hypothetical protein